MLRVELVERARSALRVGCTYRLGAGAPYNAPTPVDDHGACDCSGFVLWALGISRYQPNLQFLQRELGHLWMNTDGMICDARSATGYFSPIPKGCYPLPGDVVVYPGNFYARKIGWKKPGPRIGHTGIITETNLTGPQKVIHCSLGNMNKFGDAIAETDLSVFNHVSYSKVLRFSGVL